MANVVRIKRRAAGGSTGAPASLANAELAYNESDAGNGILYYGYGTGGVGGSATQVVAIAGDGAFVNLTGAQTISGNKTFTGTVDFSGATISGNATFGNDLTVTGNLTVNGTTTTVNSTTVTVDDKNIELGSVTSPTDAGADGGGITLKGTTDKTFNWVDATDAWTSSEHLNLLSGKSYYINGTQVLSSTALGSAVVSSSLTSVGTITSGTWNGTTIATANGGTGQSTYTDGQLLIGNTAGGLAKATLTAGTGVTITNGNGTISIASTDTNTTYTAGDGLDLSVGNEFSLDIKSGRGLQITSTELDLDDDLATLAGMQTGAATALALLTSTEVGVIDGGTTATATTLAQADRMVINDNGTMAQVALSDLVTFLEDGATSGFDVDGGTFAAILGLGTLIMHSILSAGSISC
jgi:hypothetical protein